LYEVPQFETYGHVGKKDFGEMRKKFGAFGFGFGFVVERVAMRFA
jgi:hypothetical protein